MTASVMRDFGYSIAIQNNKIRVSGSFNGRTNYTIEADWSSLSYFLNQLIVQRSNTSTLTTADSIITAKDSTIAVINSTATQPEKPNSHFKLFFAHLKNPSNQGDSKMLQFYSELGLDFEFDSNGLWAWNRSSISNYELISEDSTEQIIDWDLSDIPDTVPSLVVALSVLNKTAYLRNIHNLIYKESNRIDVLNENIHRLGFELVQDIHAPNNYTLQLLDSSKNQINCTPNTFKPYTTHSDHRMAMAFASITKFTDIDTNNSTFKPEEFSQGVKNNSTSETKEFSQWVDDVYCVEKSFPNFWQELQKMVG
jgi:5-enolpyruvylshikimate-3-phosphate synthase